MDIRAFKMDGLGNDFVIIDNRQKITNLTKDQIIKICDRNFIGCDQLIFIESSKSSDANLKFFNSDGGESGACGNGTRCVAKLISEETKSENIILSTSNGNLESKILDKNIVTTEIGKAKLQWNEIPLSEKLDTKNLNIKIIDSNNKEHSGLIRVKVWERGAGLTKACGTAACATAFAGKLNDLTENKTDIEFQTGKLSILIDDKNSIHMKGPVSEIKEIEFKL